MRLHIKRVAFVISFLNASKKFLHTRNAMQSASEKAALEKKKFPRRSTQYHVILFMRTSKRRGKSSTRRCLDVMHTHIYINIHTSALCIYSSVCDARDDARAEGERSERKKKKKKRRRGLKRSGGWVELQGGRHVSNLWMTMCVYDESYVDGGECIRASSLPSTGSHTSCRSTLQSTPVNVNDSDDSTAIARYMQVLNENKKWRNKRSQQKKK